MSAGGREAPTCPEDDPTVTPLIIDTDLSIDVDDVGALCLAHALADRCEARILAFVHDTALPEGAAGISVINEFYGRGDIPIGAYRGPVGNPATTNQPSWTNHGRGQYVEDLVQNWPEGAATASGRSVPSALKVLRASLGNAADRSVVLVSIGFLTNLLDLLESPADAVGDALPSGVQLVRAKVKRMVLMGGRARYSENPTVEWNVGGCGQGCGPYDALAGISHRALQLWPATVPIFFLGFEAGVDVHTGGSFVHDPPSFDSPCSAGYKYFCSRMPGWCDEGGRASWDPMTVLFAVRGEQGRQYYTREVGTMSIDARMGANAWDVASDQEQPPGHPAPQETLRLKSSWWGQQVGADIDVLLRQPPARWSHPAEPPSPPAPLRPPYRLSRPLMPPPYPRRPPAPPVAQPPGPLAHPSYLSLLGQPTLLLPAAVVLGVGAVAGLIVRWVSRQAQRRRWPSGHNVPSTSSEAEAAGELTLSSLRPVRMVDSTGDKE
jgi:hypothetical protein